MIIANSQANNLDYNNKFNINLDGLIEEDIG
ncbi:hypothetical protein SAMN04488528_101051 [Clostridium frigidicarnis]|uniref:Uncharacterized protein n=1 Tax=Clostridium frigidicarnis TaxID=84698 RepID=A0A1I0XX83_9CLOT|nr:hypothetical protein SAMN04488528_101051 [Clostridium frigidicarnis]